MSLNTHTDNVLGLDAVTIGQDSRIISGGADGCVKWWSLEAQRTFNLENGQNGELKPIHSGTVNCIGVRPAGDLICSGGL